MPTFAEWEKTVLEHTYEADGSPAPTLVERHPLVEVAEQLTGTKSGSWAKGQHSERPVNRHAGSGPTTLVSLLRQ